MSWYSRERPKQACTPWSAQSLRMTPDRSSGSTPCSSAVQDSANSCLASSWAQRCAVSQAQGQRCAPTPPVRGRGASRMGPRLGYSQVPQGKTCPESFVGTGGSRQESAYRTGRVRKVDLQIAHGLDNGHDGLDGVAIDDRPVLPALLLRVAILVDDPGGQGSGVKAHRAQGHHMTRAAGACRDVLQRRKLPQPTGT